ncbi:MAG: hypothetical protein NW241_18155 [Bacteroidia bacterium]|nr:hypothetical protein [Bacteroidia bacterium]
MQALEPQRLSGGLPGLSPAFGALLAEACAVCLERAGHQPGCQLRVIGGWQRVLPVHWEGPQPPEAWQAWGDPDEATEFGATGLAISLLLMLTDYTVIRRSVKGTGFDYWLGKQGEGPPFQDAARLEISGIARGDAGKAQYRFQTKVEQTRKSAGTGLPAIVIVVEFSNLEAYTGQR